MRALVVHGAEDGSPRVIADHPRPERRPGEARVAVRVAGVCDTDLQLVRGYMGYRGVLGHEFVGEVIESDDLAWRGRRVVADINAGCGRCDECRARGGHHCASRTVLGILGRDGAMAEELVIPERCLVEVPGEIDDDRAVFAEPLAAALHVLDAVDADRAAAGVAVIGDGKLGLLIAAAVAGAGHPTLLVGHHRTKLERAVAIDAAIETMLEDELDAARRAAVAVEATGTAGGLERALSLCAPRGTVVLKSTIAGRHDVDLAPVVINELSIAGSRCGDLGAAISRLSGSGAIDPRPLVEARYPLAEADRALEHAGRPGALKILIDV